MIIKLSTKNIVSQIIFIIDIKNSYKYFKHIHSHFNELVTILSILKCVMK